ncbi:LOW QUALITY PROTEIN: Hypothetical protein PHPALM_21093 [Phytophthora palmivora]|uniref:Uncharacterized protein n=1 Tax=Phytophthora palmivora TaxID=4796 RepID=A0A2P4XD83_9STRA|nr:LOW QUALITY PROTEIN: Hypothetical protein PHPALM_21093 [Phytophthora palmivora]
MDNATTSSTNETLEAAATQQAASTNRTLRSGSRTVTRTMRAGNSNPGRGKGRRPARNTEVTMTRQSGSRSSSSGLRSGSMPMSASQEPEYPTVAHPIFAVTAAPKIEDISHEALTQWIDLRLEYEEIMKARCESSGEDLNHAFREELL